MSSDGHPTPMHRKLSGATSDFSVCGPAANSPCIMQKLNIRTFFRGTAKCMTKVYVSSAALTNEA